MKKSQYHIRGMHCRSCEIVLEEKISKIAGVKRVEVSHKRGVAEVEFTGAVVYEGHIARAVREAGYSLGRAEKPALVASDSQDYFEIILGFSALLMLYIVSKITGISGVFSANVSTTPTYPIVFVIGLTAGVSTCMAVVGGLVAAFSASHAVAQPSATGWEKFRPNIFFNAGRLVSYAVLGGVIGLLGSVFKISSGVSGFLVAVAGMLMLYMGLKLTGISPRLSASSITLPKKLSRALGIHDSSDYSHKGAFWGGALTFFLPCGFTQAMQLYAMTTGSFVAGGIIMFLFALGTMPGLLSLGALTSFLKGRAASMFFRLVGIVLVILGLFNISNGFTLTGLNIPFSSGGSSDTAGNLAELPPVEGGEQVVSMAQVTSGYVPNKFTIKKGIPVKWIIDSQSSYTCAASIRVPSLGIVQGLRPGENIIRFTPASIGTIRFTCSMGMYSGAFAVVD